MTTSSHSETLELYQSEQPGISREQMLGLIERESQTKYPHLHVRFYPNRCMQAKVAIKGAHLLLSDDTPQVLIDILSSERFVLEHFTHRLPHCNGGKDKKQYVLQNRELKTIGYQFVMKATFGPSFISFWFRNESNSERIDLPVFYALEILNKISHKVDEAVRRGELEKRRAKRAPEEYQDAFSG